MTTQRCVVAELFIFEDFLTRAHGVEEVGLVINHIAVSLGRTEYLRRFALSHAMKRMLSFELRQVLIAKILWPAKDRVVFRLWPGVLRGVGESLALQGKRPLSSVKADVVA